MADVSDGQSLAEKLAGLQETLDEKKQERRNYRHEHSEDSDLSEKLDALDKEIADLHKTVFQLESLREVQEAIEEGQVKFQLGLNIAQTVLPLLPKTLEEIQPILLGVIKPLVGTYIGISKELTEERKQSSEIWAENKHMLFEALTKAGFSEEQAMQLVLASIHAGSELMRVLSQSGKDIFINRSK